MFRYLKVTLTRDPVTIKGSKCECKAGVGGCSHSIGLLYVICHYLKLEYDSVPLVISKTSQPQIWHIPQRSEGLHAKAVDSLTINKVNPVPKTTKRKRVTEGVLPKLYCPVSKPIPSASFTTSLLEQLNADKNDAQIQKVLPTSPSPPSVESKFGLVPFGSVISYQQRPQQKDGDIINHSCQPTYPPFPLPPQVPTNHHVPTETEQEVFLGLQVTLEHAYEVEQSTREQSQNKTWHDVRKHRLTSSNFKQVCSRKKDHASLAVRFLSSKNIQTQAMKFGIEHEPEAAKLYSEVTGNNVYLSGFVINPSAPHLGASPDRKVFVPNDPNPYGLLEIKCPDKHHFEKCDYLKKTNNGTYKLKSIHAYYYQMMGQMALTGTKWCDFLVKCKNDYHLERIMYDEEEWIKMKTSLDLFFFNYYLPQICSK
ncbi:Hypp3665 [Branchiostoma lanceolatum]|uniref:Hypp3665 protein n=1 Tax=Branchiostoma lanceolatum TaxID=7740 RepID=A0A8K0A318_BRALA|nr:Hypp3665 [Branchiostoma lanceolatum]